MSIAGDLIRGHTDAIILARLLRGDSYGYEINKVISTLSNNRFELKEATLYTAFKRLEELGYIASYWGDSGAGARRREPFPSQKLRRTLCRGGFSAGRRAQRGQPDRHGAAGQCRSSTGHSGDAGIFPRPLPHPGNGASRRHVPSPAGGCGRTRIFRADF